MAASEREKAEYALMAREHVAKKDTTSIELLLEVWDSASAMALAATGKRMTNGELIEYLDGMTKMIMHTIGSAGLRPSPTAQVTVLRRG